MKESFYVCFYKNKSGDRIGHGISTKNEFPDNIVKIIDNDSSTKNRSKFQEIYSSFCDSMNGYMDMLPLVAGIGAAITYNIRESELIGFCKENMKSHKDFERREVFELPLSRIGEFQSIDRRHHSGELVSKQIPKMLLMGVVSSLDHHIAQLMREVIRKNPNILSSTEKNVSAQEVLLSESIDDFKDMLVEREVDTATRESFEDQILWLEKKIPINESIKKDYDIWNELVEIIERRNLFAHADGIVNARYLRKINKKSDNPRLSVGDELRVSNKYFSASLDNICEFGVKLSQVVWRKSEPTEANIADKLLGDFGFVLIERGEYKLACRILEFARTLRGKKDEARRRMDIVNLANAYRLSGNVTKSDEILDSEDWGIVSDDFAVSVAAVRGDVERVDYFIARMAQAGDWTGEELEQWPVFYGIRDDTRFVQAFEKAYRRKYSPAPVGRNRILENFYKVSKSNKVFISESDKSAPLGDAVAAVGSSKKIALRSAPKAATSKGQNQRD